MSDKTLSIVFLFREDKFTFSENKVKVCVRAPKFMCIMCEVVCEIKCDNFEAFIFPIPTGRIDVTMNYVGTEGLPNMFRFGMGVSIPAEFGHLTICGTNKARLAGVLHPAILLQ